MITINLEEMDVFKIMTGSLDDRVQLLVSDEVMKKLDVKTLERIIQLQIDNAKKKGDWDDDKLTDVIKLLQYVAYNRQKSEHSDEIATYVFDKLFEIISHEF